MCGLRYQNYKSCVAFAMFAKPRYYQKPIFFYRFVIESRIFQLFTLKVL